MACNGKRDWYLKVLEGEKRGGREWRTWWGRECWSSRLGGGDRRSQPCAGVGESNANDIVARIGDGHENTKYL
jgi:hypothetical protein